MYKHTILTVIILLSVSMSFLYSNITRTEAINIVMSNVVAESEGHVQVYANQTVTSGSIVTITSKHTLSLPYSNNWVFFIDDMVFADWGHPCRYVFVNSLNGDYQILNEQYYPSNLSDYEVVSGMEVQLSPYNPEITTQNRTFRSINPRLYAILVNGMSGQY